MCWISWLRWPDTIIDFGEQVYIAWRLSEGDVLYRDIAYFYGPLSSYLHALLFKLFGASLLVLVGFNLLLVAGLTLLIVRIFLRLGTAFTAYLAGFTFLMVFAFAQYLWMGNHNFVCSYVYDVTHGIFLSFLAAGQYWRFAQSRKPGDLVVLGLLSGLVLLTKIEVSLAWMLAVLTGLALLARTQKLSLQETGRWALWFVAGLILPIAGFTLYFMVHLGWAEGFQAMLGPWTYVFSSSIRSLSFYQSVMGTDALGANLIRIASYLVGWIAFLGMLGILGYALRKPFERSPLLAGLGMTLWVFLFYMLQRHIPWLQLLLPLPLVLTGISAFLCFKIWTGGAVFKDSAPQLLLATLCIFSTALLLKIFFNTHVYHYGTALAMPGTLILFKLLTDDLPSKLDRHSVSHFFFRGSVIGGLALFTLIHFGVSAGYYSKKVFPVGYQADTLIGYNPNVAPNALVFQIAYDVLKEDMKEGDTLATFPTGTLMNYLLRKPNSINSISFNPGTGLLLGESRVLNDLQAAPPTHIAIVYHDYLEFGARFFGKDFGKEIYQWILKDYESLKLIGRDPVEGEGFGIHLFKRKPENPASP